MQEPLFKTLAETEVTLSPAGVAEWPFFCLSRMPAHRQRKIECCGTDDAGRPFKWLVTAGSDGMPGEAAWEIWLTIIQPLLHAHQPLRHGMLIPLGGLRHCLRVLGWTESGPNAEVLIRGIKQIAGASVEFEIWQPLPPAALRVSTDGANYRRVSGKGTRLSSYLIGEYEVTEEELASGEVTRAYDLSEVLSIRVALEADLQRQVIYRPLDQAYVRAVNPSARRWYELTAASVYGAVSHPRSPGYFEMRYSWYVMRHHTLEPQTGLRRIRMQMEKVTKDHVNSGYLRKIEYGETADGHDVIIRYYPGTAARRSISRVKSMLAGRRGLIAVTDDAHEFTTNPTLPLAEPVMSADGPARALIQQLVNEFGLIEKVARRLVLEGREAVEEQLAAYPYRKATPQNPAAFLVQAIREHWPLPEAYLAERARHTAVQEQEAVQAQQAARYEQYAAQFQAYQDEQLAALSRAYPDKWEAFLQDTESRRQHMLQSPNEEMRYVAADPAAMQRYNGWLFFSYDETTRYADFDEWLAMQND